jgi:sugar fermentation stimulation protein A
VSLPEGSFYRLVPATFVARPNRFVILARLDRRLVRVASRDPGRLRELLRPGAPLRLAPSDDPRRATRFTAVLVRRGRRWVSMIPAHANAVLAASLAKGGLPGLRGARVARREVAHGGSRFDYLLRWRGRDVLTEVKSASLVVNGRALFPDAPTTRGTRHVRELTAHASRGGQALVVFVVQHGAARSLEPHAGHDPEFARALREAKRVGVRLRAYACRVSPRGVSIRRRIPVVFR